MVVTEYLIGAVISVVVGKLIGMKMLPERRFEPSALFPTPVICLGILVTIKVAFGVSPYVFALVGVLTPILIKSYLNKLCPVVE